jgi:hypothetical protein
VLATVAAFAHGASADPIVITQATPLGGGLVAYDVAVDFRDGLARSGFVEITFTGGFDTLSTLLAANWPDLQQVDPGVTSSNVYRLRGGTGGGSQVDVVGVAQLVLPEGAAFSYDGVISRNGRSFIVVPEPGIRPLSLSGALTVAALSLSRGLRGHRSRREDARARKART